MFTKGMDGQPKKQNVFCDLHLMKQLLGVSHENFKKADITGKTSFSDFLKCTKRDRAEQLCFYLVAPSGTDWKLQPASEHLQLCWAH